MARRREKPLAKAERIIYDAIGEDHEYRSRAEIALDAARELSIRRMIAGTEQAPPRKIAPDDTGMGADGQWKLWHTDTHIVAAGPGPDGAVSIAQHTVGLPAKLTPEQAHTLARVLDTAAQSQPNLKPPAEGTEN